jgi:hypothetical protein
VKKGKLILLIIFVLFVLSVILFDIVDYMTLSKSVWYGKEKAYEVRERRNR